jgi:hypothetical protein
VEEDESILVRIMQELRHRRRYGQDSASISLGPEAYFEACALKAIDIRPDMSKALLGLAIELDPGLAPTCFEIR